MAEIGLKINFLTCGMKPVVFGTERAATSTLAIIFSVAKLVPVMFGIEIGVAGAYCEDTCAVSSLMAHQRVSEQGILIRK